MTERLANLINLSPVACAVMPVDMARSPSALFAKRRKRKREKGRERGRQFGEGEREASILNAWLLIILF